MENKEEVVVEIKYDFFILSMIFLVPIFFVIILILNLDEIDAKPLGRVVGILIYIMFLKIEKFEIVSK